MLRNKANGRAAVFKKIITSVVMLGMAVSLCSCSGSTTATHKTLSSEQLEEEAIKSNNAKVRKFIKDALGFEMDEYIDEAELMIDTVKTNSKGNACILVKSGKENDLLALMEKNIGRENNIGPNQIPAELNNQYATELRKMSPLKNWEASGASIYLARNGSRSYLYIFA